MFKIICFFLGYLMCATANAQTSVSDPTKPLNYLGVTASGEHSEQETIQLSSILISSDRKVAIINGQPLQENQTLKGVGALVKKIDADAVTLQQNGKVRRIALNNTTIRK